MYVCSGATEDGKRFCTPLFQDSTSINSSDIAKYLPTGTN